MFQKILVAIDASQLSRQAYDEALALAKASGSQLALLHVLAPPMLNAGAPTSMFPGLGGIPGGYQPELVESYLRQWEENQKHGSDLLQSRLSEATALGLTVESIQRFGDPGQEICKLARDWGANLIILGRRGLTGLREMILGSVSNYVIHHAPCSVLIVQEQEGASAESAES